MLHQQQPVALDLDLQLVAGGDPQLPPQIHRQHHSAQLVHAPNVTRLHQHRSTPWQVLPVPPG